MKHKIILSLAVLFGLSNLNALDEDHSITLDFTLASQYVFRGVELGDTTLHPSIEYTTGNFYAGVWGATPLENDNIWGDEIDYYGGFAIPVLENASLDIGVNWYTYPGSGPKSLEGKAGLAWDLEGFTPAIYVYRDFYYDSWNYELSGGYSVPTGANSIDFSVFYGSTDLALGSQYYYGLDIEAPIAINDKTALTFGLHYTNVERGNANLFGTASVSFGF